MIHADFLLQVSNIHREYHADSQKKLNNAVYKECPEKNSGGVL